MEKAIKSTKKIVQKSRSMFTGAFALSTLALLGSAQALGAGVYDILLLSKVYHQILQHHSFYILWQQPNLVSNQSLDLIMPTYLDLLQVQVCLLLMMYGRLYIHMLHRHT